MPRRIISPGGVVFSVVLVLVAIARSFSGEQSHAGLRHTRTMKVDAAGVPRTLYGLRSSPSSDPPETAARAFLNEHASLLRLQDIRSDLSTERVAEVPGGYHVRFSQRYKGIPVFRSDVVVSQDIQRRVSMVVNNSWDDIRIPTVAPSLTADQALGAARQHLRAEGERLGKEDHADLMVYPLSGGGHRLAYRVSMTCATPYGDWEVFVDAATGEILHVEDCFVMHSAEATGSGYVYLSDPLSAARASYGAAGFSDDNDGTTEQLNASRALVTLEHLTFEDGVFKLKGPFCTITEIEDPDDPVFYGSASPEGFQYTRSDPGFEAVMCYYQITQAATRLLSLGFQVPGLGAIRVDPHGFQGKDNSHYSPGGNWISFGTGGVDDAEDADVIWHEYGHAIVYGIVPDWGGGEAGPLAEGFCDYLAASYSRSLQEWTAADQQSNWLFNWDGHNPFWSGRVVNDPQPYPFTNLSLHQAGQAWASALVSILGDLGRDITDRLVIKSLYYLGSSPTAVDHAQALLQADRDLYGGIHLPTLIYWLGTMKNVLPSDSMGVILIVNDDLNSAADSLRTGTKGVNLLFRDPGRPSSTAFFSTCRPPQGYAVQTTSFARLDVTRLPEFSAIVLVGGLNDRPFDDRAKRTAIVRYAEAGGKVLTEGGEVGYYYRQTVTAETDPVFRKAVLSTGRFLSDAVDAQLLSEGPDDPLFALPNPIPSPLTFLQQSSFADRDAMATDEASVPAFTIGRWSTEPEGGSVFAQHDGAGSVRTLFFPFAVSSVADSVIARALVENALCYLLLSHTPTTDVVEASSMLPGTLTLRQNYPNPFNPATTIEFELPEESLTTLAVFNTLGQEIASIIEGVMPAGRAAVVWDAADAKHGTLSSGVYFYRLTARPLRGGSALVTTRSMILLR